MTGVAYIALKQAIIRRGYEKEIDWAETIRPITASEDDRFWTEYSWVVLNSGMKNQVARGIWDKVEPAVRDGKSASSVFGHKGKSAAIDQCWHRRVDRVATFCKIRFDASRLKWLRGLPWIGPITCWHLAKNYGMDVAKPDRHLARISGDEGTHAMCDRLSKETGDRVGVVDLVIWRAANLGLV